MRWKDNNVICEEVKIREEAVEASWEVCCGQMKKTPRRPERRRRCKANLVNYCNQPARSLLLNMRKLG